MKYSNWKDVPLSWIQFHDKLTMVQWVESNRLLPEPGMIIAHTSWESLRVYFVLSKEAI